MNETRPYESSESGHGLSPQSEAVGARRRVRDFLDTYDGTAFPNLISGLVDGYTTRTLYASDLRLLLHDMEHPYGD